MINLKSNSSLILAGLMLAFGLNTVTYATTYKAEEVIRTQSGNTDFGIRGSKSLNNDGQVIYQATTYSADKVFNDGSRAWLWKHGKTQALGTFGNDALGYAESTAVQVNDAGAIAGHSLLFTQAIDQGSRAFQWQDGRLRALATSNFVATESTAINSRGGISGNGRLFEQGQDKGTRAVLWNQGKAINLGSLGVNSSGVGYSISTGLNNQFKVVGESEVYTAAGDWSGSHAFLWVNGTITDLGFLGFANGFNYSSAVAINDNNKVVGYSDLYDSTGNWTGYHAFLWANGAMQDLGFLGADIGYVYSIPNAINAKDQVIGSSDVYDSSSNWLGNHAFLWSKGVILDLGVFGVDAYGTGYSFPNALNDKGQVVGFSTYSEGGVAKGNRAFLYQNGILTDLNKLVPASQGLLLTNAIAINNQGQILAFGTKTTATETYDAYVLLSP